MMNRPSPSTVTTTPPYRPAFPWADAMAFGLGHLKLPPQQFWQLTPRELVQLAGLSPSRSARPDAARLSALYARYPDHLPKGLTP